MENMHDWTLGSIILDWNASKAELTFQSPEQQVKLLAKNVVSLKVPHTSPWGNSESVNSQSGPTAQDGGGHLLTIEMQSGDLIEIIAASFQLV